MISHGLEQGTLVLGHLQSETTHILLRTGHVTLTNQTVHTTYSIMNDNFLASKPQHNRI